MPCRCETELVWINVLEVARLLLRNKLKRLDRMMFFQRFSGLSHHQVAKLVGFRSLQLELTLV